MLLRSPRGCEGFSLLPTRMAAKPITITTKPTIRVCTLIPTEEMVSSVGAPVPSPKRVNIVNIKPQRSTVTPTTTTTVDMATALRWESPIVPMICANSESSGGSIIVLVIILCLLVALRMNVSLDATAGDAAACAQYTYLIAINQLINSSLRKHLNLENRRWRIGSDDAPILSCSHEHRQTTPCILKR